MLGIAPGTDLPVHIHQLLPPTLIVNPPVGVVVLRVMLLHVLHNDRFVTAAQIEILEPILADEVPRLVDDGLPVGNVDENGRHEENGVDPVFVERAQRVEPFGDGAAPVHVPTECLVQRIDRHGHTDVLHPFQQVEVAENELVLGGDLQIAVAVHQLFEDGTGDFVLGLIGIVAIRCRTHEDILPVDLAQVDLLVTLLDIQKLAPGFRMVGEAFHERCVAVLARMGAAYIGVDGITADLRRCKQILGLFLCDNHDSIPFKFRSGAKVFGFGL